MKMKALSKKTTTIIASVLLIFLIYIGYRVTESRKHMDTLKSQAAQNDTPSVAIVHAEPLPAKETIQLPGTIEAWFQAPIYAQVSGYVKMWYKDWGARVKKGDVLAEIYAPALDAQYRQSKADLASEIALNDLAKLTADRWIALRKNQAVSEQSISVKVAEAKAQQAKVNAARQNVSNFEALINFKTIVAPYDGVVINRAINVGDYINKEGTISTPRGDIRNLYTVADISRLRLFVSVPERYGSLMREGLKADLTVPQFPNRHFTAEFLTTAHGFDVNTRTVVTQFVIENKEKDLWPGSYASVNLTVDVDSSEHLSIPSSSLVFDEMGTRVAVVDDDSRVHFKPIKITRILDATVELSEGVTPEDRIINNPSAALLEGDKVTVVTPAPGYDMINAPHNPASESSKPSSNVETPPESSKPAPHAETPPESSKPASNAEKPNPELKQALKASHVR